MKLVTTVSTDRFFGFLLYASDFIQIIPEFISLFLEFSNTTFLEVIPSLTTTLMGVLAGVKTSKFVFDGKRLEAMIQTLEELDIRAREVLGDEKVNELSKYKEYICDISTYLVLVDVISIISWSGRSLYLATIGIKDLIIDSYIPWDWQSSWTAWSVVYVIQVIHVSTAMYGMILFDTLVFCIIQMWVLEVDCLKHAFSQLDFTPPSVDLNGKVTLRFCAQFHQDLRDLMRDINDFIKHLILFQSVLITAVICLGLFESYSVGHTPLIKKINLCQLLFYMVYSLCFYSMTCQNVENANLEITRATYHNNWYVGTVKDRRSLLMITEQCKVQDHVGLIVYSNLESLITVLKTSFTYFNFLRAISSRD